MAPHFRPIMLALAALASPVSAAVAPRVGDDQIQRPLPLPYDQQADAEADVAAAKARAIKGHKLLLIDLGGNWCLDCRVLAGVLDIPGVSAFMKKHYELVSVDIGRMDKNQQIPARYGIGRLEGVPALLVVNPRTGRLLNAGRVSALADARSMSAQALADWLAQWI